MIAILLYSVLYLVLFGITDLLYHKMNVAVETTRKIVHVSTGLIAMTFPIYLDHFWQVLALCCSFLLLMAVSEKLYWFKSITAIERKSYGSWLFALIVLCCFYIQVELNNMAYYYLPILVLSISDPIAALVGKATQFVPIKVFGSTKTLGGSIAFLVTTSLILLVFDQLSGTGSWPIIYIVLSSIVVTVAELLSTKGWDNLTIPLTTVVLIYLINQFVIPCC